MTQIYLVRHAEAEGNIYRRAQGSYESLVSAKGMRQIEALAERFRSTPVDALYSSDMKRTQCTAGAILKYHNLPLETTKALRELNLGSWEDRPFGDLSHEYPEMMLAFNDDPARWRAEGAETFAALTERVMAFLREVALRHDGQTVVCVSHGMAIRAALASVLNISSENISTLPHGDNTAVSLLEWEDGAFRAVYCNDISHLPEKLSTFSRQTWWKQPGNVDPNNVWFRRLNPSARPQEYTNYYSAAWLAVHGTLAGFFPAVYLEDAIAHSRSDPDCVVEIIKNGTGVGMTELDPVSGKDEGIGKICLCYIRKEERRQQLGAQLIGHAVSFFRKRGYRVLQLHVFSGNTGAIAFYEEYGFRRIGETEGSFGPLLTMEKEL